MNAIYKLLVEIRSVNGKNDKIELLRKNSDLYFLEKYLSLVYSPQNKYYIKKLPEVVEQRGSTSERQFYFDLETFCSVASNRDITGNELTNYVSNLLQYYDFEQRELFRFLTQHDVEAGINISTINKVFPDLLFVPPYQRCGTEEKARFDKWDWSVHHLVQLKADGMFVNAIKKDNVLTFMTRSGNVFPSGVLGALEERAVIALDDDTITLGELVIEKDGAILPRQTGNGMLNSLLQGGTLEEGYKVKLLFWDSVDYYDWKYGESLVPYDLRLEAVSWISDPYLSQIETRLIHSPEQAKEIALEWMAQGYEGAIVKNRDGTWKDHTSPNQIKIKAEIEVELRIVGMLDGKGKNEDTFGSLCCVSEDELLKVDVSGFTDKEREDIFDNWHEKYYGQVITVRANQLLKPSKSNKHYSLFLPRFIEVRSDRQEADTLERIISVFKSYQPDL